MRLSIFFTIFVVLSAPAAKAGPALSSLLTSLYAPNLAPSPLRDPQGRAMIGLQVQQESPNLFFGVYYVLEQGQRTCLRLATATNLAGADWTTRATLDCNSASHGELKRLPNGRYLLAYQKDTSARSSHIRLVSYPSALDLLQNQPDRAFTVPLAAQANAEGTPNFRWIRFDENIDKLSIEIGFHLNRKSDAKNINAIGLLEGFKNWRFYENEALNNAVEQYSQGDIGDRSFLIYQGQPYTLVESMTSRNDPRSWKLFLFNESANLLAPLAVNATNGAFSIGNPNLSLALIGGNKQLISSVCLASATQEAACKLYHLPVEAGDASVSYAVHSQSADSDFLAPTSDTIENALGHTQTNRGASVATTSPSTTANANQNSSPPLLGLNANTTNLNDFFTPNLSNRSAVGASTAESSAVVTTAAATNSRNSRNTEFCLNRSRTNCPPVWNPQIAADSRHVQYFGYLASDFTGIFAQTHTGGYMDEIKDHITTPWIEDDVENKTKKLQHAEALHMKAVVVGHNFFNSSYHLPAEDSNSWREHLDAWKVLAAKLRPHKDSIAAFYIFDEPYGKGVPMQVMKPWLERVIRAVKQEFPETPTAITFEINDLKKGPSMMPQGLDWAGFDCYGDFDKCPGQARLFGLFRGSGKPIPYWYTLLKRAMRPGQRTYLVGDGIIGPNQKRAQRLKKMPQGAWSYYGLCKLDPDCIGIFPFTYQSFADGKKRYTGVRDMPKLLEAFRKIGRQISGK